MPEKLGLSTYLLQAIQGGSPEENAKLIMQIFEGVRGPQRDAVILNAAAGLLAAEKVNCLQDGVNLASEVIDTGKARQKLQNMIDYSHSPSRTER